MANLKSGAIFALKVVAAMLVTAFLLNIVGVNLFALISSPVATIKNLVTPAQKSA